MLMRLVMIGLLLTQPLRVCFEGVCEAVCRAKGQPTPCCERACAAAAKPPCCKAACERTEPVCLCAFCPKSPREPVSPPNNPPSVNDQSLVLPMALACAADADRPNLLTAAANWACLCRGSPSSFRQASLCVWLI